MSLAVNAKLERDLREWPLARAPTSDVYTVTCDGDTVVLGLLTEHGTEERGGALLARPTTVRAQ